MNESFLGAPVNMQTVASFSRRHVVRALAATALSSAVPMTSRAHGQVGVVLPPVALPAFGSVALHDGRHVPLQSILQGKTTAMQLMFTGCSQTCPLQGALFSTVQERLSTHSNRNIQFLSLSIDASDNAKSLSVWLHRFGAKKNWIAAVPTQKGIDAIRAVLQQRAAPDSNHSTQVYFMNTQGLLIWRSEDFPPPEVITRIFEKISAI